MSKTTHLICILDRSGSMAGVADEVRTNFNHFLKEQKELEGKAKITLVLFDDKYELIYDEVDLKKAKPLSEEQYYARGMTAMNDAVGRTLTNKSRKKKAIVFIHTDGYENHSREYSDRDIKKLVKKLKDKWEFIFVGADIDAKRVSSDYGFRHTLGSSKTRAGLTNTYDMFNTTAACYRSSGGAVNSAATINAVAEANAKEGKNSDPAVDILDQIGHKIDNDFNIADWTSDTTTKTSS